MNFLMIVVGVMLFVAGFLCGCRVVFVRYITIDKVKTSDLYPVRGDDDGPNAG